MVEKRINNNLDEDSIFSKRFISFKRNNSTYFFTTLFVHVTYQINKRAVVRQLKNTASRLTRPVRICEFRVE